jgi:ferredoxin
MTQPTVESFSEMLVDLARHLAPPLTICDAVVSMEGAGPSHGNPRSTGLLMAATDPFALDYAIGLWLGVGPEGFTTLAAQLRRGYGPATPDELEIVLADPSEDLSQVVPDPPVLGGQAAVSWLASRRPAGFALLEPENLSSLQGRGRVRTALRLLQPLLRSRPVFRARTCNGCGTCIKSCPARALRLVNRVPELRLRDCIRCYCCQELCPRGAVDIRRPALARLIYRRR